MKKLQRLRVWIEEYATSPTLKFWIEFFTTRQILIEKFHNDQILKKNLLPSSPLSTAFTP